MSTTNQNPLVNLLRNKDKTDDDLSEKYSHFDYVAANKSEFFLHYEEQSLHNKNLMGNCLKPCMTNL